MSEISKAESEESLIRDGYRHATDGYEGYHCHNPDCRRNRVALRKNGKVICEKCNWDQNAEQYDMGEGL